MSFSVSTQPHKAGSDRTQLMELTFHCLSKRFGRVLANDDVSFTIEAGGIHAVVGENGAGKSTLTKMLSGYYQPDSGAIFLDGQKLVLRSANAARRAGIGMVHQQLALVPSLTGVENVILGDPKLPFFMNNKILAERVKAKADGFGFNLDLNVPVAKLGIADRQKLEIFKLLWKDARVLILDEPTSQLTPLEADEILTILADLASSGRIVILITHHINEVLKYARAVTVLRRGRCVANVSAATLNSASLAKLMVDLDDASITRAAQSTIGKNIVTLEKVTTRGSGSARGLLDIDFSINQGEVVGVAGISGSGQNELGQLLAGLLQPAAGKVSWGAPADKHQKKGKVTFIPCDQKQGTVPSLSLKANCFLKSINERKSMRFGFIAAGVMEKRTRELINTFDVRPALADLPAAALSGGNLQKLLVARELETDSDLIVADNPCAGLDALVSTRVRQRLRQEADSGRGVVLISPDLEELMAVCDRIVVMFNGRVIGERLVRECDYQSLALLLGGKA